MSPSSAARARGVANALAVRDVYGRERSPYRSIPQDRRGPGKLTGGHRVTLQAWTVNLQVTALLGAAGGKLTGGVGGGWSQISVPRRDPLTQWSGRSLLTMDLDLMLDGWGAQTSVEPSIKTIEQLASRLPGMLTPPSLRIFGAVPAPGTRWVISGIDYGDALRSIRTGQRLRQELTLHLTEFRDDTALATLPRGVASSTAPRKYKVKHGDDLKKIATRMLGKSSHWPQIVKLNKGLRGWKIPAKLVGKTIKIPAAK